MYRIYIRKELRAKSNLCDIEVQGKKIEKVHEFKYLEFMVNDRGTEKIECKTKVMNGSRVAGAIKALENERS